MTYRAIGNAPGTTSVQEAAGIPGAVELVVEGIARDPTANSYTEMAEAIDAMGIATRRFAGRNIFLVSPPGSNQKVADIEQGSGRPRMLHGLGAAPGRRLEVINHRTRKRYTAANMKQAVILAKRMASRAPGDTIHIHLPGGAPSRQNLLAVVDLVRGVPRVRLNRSLSGLGDVLTDWACDSHEFATAWKRRVNDGLDTGAQAVVLGAGIAGLLGGLLKRPLLGAAIGAATGWATYAIWTAPQRVS
jgi:hypothetical protein